MAIPSIFVDAIDKTGFQHELSTAGSQKSEPTVGARGSRAPKGLVRGGPPGIPGKPRPALRKPFAFSGRSGLGARRLVVAGVMILAEIPLEAGAPTGGIGEITTGGCWAGSVPGAFWADPVDHPPKRLKQIEANSVPNNWGIGGRVGGLGGCGCGCGCGCGSGTGDGGKGLGSEGMGPGSGHGCCLSEVMAIILVIFKHGHRHARPSRISRPVPKNEPVESA